MNLHTIRVVALSPSAVTDIQNLDQLDRLLAQCDLAANDDDLRSIFAGFRMALPSPAAGDPLGQAYHDEQMALYRRIAGRDYALANEATPFDVDAAAVSPFPFSTGSCRTAGAHFVLIGEVLRHLRIPRGGRIVEFGPGWGNLTLALAGLGYDVTAVDVEDRFCRLISRRAERMGLSVRTVNADFSWAGGVTEPYDAAIFFECFHHAADHLALLRSLHNTVKPGGLVYLGAEPILADFPIPWGLRMDGQSLWSIRKFGWMELGFRDDYFRAAVEATGWHALRHPVAEPAIWELSSTLLPLHVGAGSPVLGTQTGARRGEHIVFDQAEAGFGLFGPYANLPAGRYQASLTFDGGTPLAGGGELQVTCDGSRRVLARRHVAAADLQASCSLAFVLDQPSPDVEVRLLNDPGFSGSFVALRIEVDPQTL